MLKRKVEVLVNIAKEKLRGYDFLESLRTFPLFVARRRSIEGI